MTKRERLYHQRKRITIIYSGAVAVTNQYNYEPVNNFMFLDEEYPMCYACNGSGEGPADGTICWRCQGSGIIYPEQEESDP